MMVRVVNTSGLDKGIVTTYDADLSEWYELAEEKVQEIIKSANPQITWTPKKIELGKAVTV